MVRIADSRDVGRVGVRSGRIAPSGPSVSVGNAMQRLGGEIQQAAFNLQDLQAQEKVDGLRSNGFELETKIAKFRDAEEQAFNAAKEGSSASGIGFTRQFMEGYQERADTFIKDNFSAISEAQDASARQTLLGLGNSLYGKSNSYETGAKAVYYDRETASGLDSVRNNIRGNSAPYEELKKQGLALIDKANMPEPWKAERRAQWDADAAESKWRWKFEQDPEGAVAAVRPGGDAIGTTVNKIIGVESGGNPNAKNPSSSATGLGQFTSGTWRAMMEQHPELGLTADGRTDPTQARKATFQHTKDNAAALAAAGHQVNPGTLYLAHFAGIGGAKQVLRADDGAAIEDVLGPGVVNANGFLRGKNVGWLKNWARGKMEGSKGAPADDYSDIPLDRREQLTNWGEAQVKQQQAEQRVVSQMVIQQAVDNAPTAIQQTGGYSGQMPTPEQFASAYGNQAASKYAEFQQQVATAQGVYQLKSSSNDELQAVLDAPAPTSSGDTAAADMDRYTALQKAAGDVMKARSADPAGYVRSNVPAVDRAWASVNSPATYRAAVGASIAAQQQLGVTDIQPLPKPIAADAVKTFKDVDKPGTERVAAVSQAIMATDDPTQRRAIFEQMVDAGLPENTEGAFEAMARGDRGAAERLFQASMIDPSKLPGKLPSTDTEIDQTIQDSIMAAGQVGDVYYGLSDGTQENYVRAQRDASLMLNAVKLRMVNGEDLEAAVAGASKDLYGNVQVLTGDSRVNAQVLVPADADADKVLDGLAGVLPEVDATLRASLNTPGGPSTDSFGKKFVGQVTDNYVTNVMAEGFFRNSGDGYVFIDPYTGSAVSNDTGEPVVFRPTDAVVGQVREKQAQERATRAKAAAPQAAPSPAQEGVFRPKDSPFYGKTPGTEPAPAAEGPTREERMQNKRAVREQLKGLDSSFFESN